MCVMTFPDFACFQVLLTGSTDDLEDRAVGEAAWIQEMLDLQSIPAIQIQNSRYKCKENLSQADVLLASEEPAQGTTGNPS